MSLVSVVMLMTDKNHPFLSDAVSSLYRQTFKDFELVVIVPESLLVVNKFSSFLFSGKAKVFAYPKSENFSVSQGSNFGIAQAEGKYVVRLDPDDRFDENFLVVAVNHLERGEKSYGAVYPDFLEVDEKGEVIGYGSPEVSFEFNPLDAGVMYNKEKFLEVGGYDERLFRQVSYDLMRRFIQRFDVKHVSLPLYHYRKHSSNMSQTPRVKEDILFARRQIENNGKKVLCIIPVRGGSKGISLKNLYNLNGKPLFYWSLKAAQQSKLIDRIIISTDHEGVKESALSFKNEFSKMEVVDRPDYLATDEISIISVAAYHLEEVSNFEKVSAVVCLQATSPLVSSEDLDLGLFKFFSTDCDSVVSIYSISHGHPFRVMKMAKDRLYPFNEAYDERTLNRKDLPACYAYNGAFFIRKPYLLQNYNGRDFGLGKDCRGLIMPENRSVNIDTLWDMRLAEFLVGKE